MRSGFCLLKWLLSIITSGLSQQHVKRTVHRNESVAFSRFAEEIRLEPTVKFDVHITVC